jgi:hypothetical protein
MPLTAAWVDSLFARLTVRYGVAFLRQYQDIDPAAVKADWAEVLDGFDRHPEAIKHALANMPADKPPTVLQFRDAARKAPTPEAPRLPEPPADPAP